MDEKFKIGLDFRIGATYRKTETNVGSYDERPMSSLAALCEK